MVIEYSMSMQQKITAQLIIEIAGFPKEHIEDVLDKLVENIKEQYEVLESNTEEVKQIKELWSSFVDIKIRFKDLNQMTVFCFDYMPSSIDILDPLKFNFESIEINGLFNDLMGKIHHYDMLLKNFKAMNEMLKRGIKK